MKRNLLLLIFSSLFAVSSFAQSGVCGDSLVWNFDSETGTLTISGTGEMWGYLLDFGSYYDQIRQIEIEDGVTSIGAYAFSGFVNLTSVKIPNSVFWIGKNAFSYCIRLTSVTIPASVWNIGFEAFFCCYGLTSINVESANLSYMSKEGVLFDKSGATLICFPCIKSGEYIIPQTVTSIESGAFNSCKGLTFVTIPNSVTSIGDYTFSYCSGLTSVTIPNSVISIGDYAFSSCSSLISIKIPNSVASIGDGAFASCIGLLSIEVDNENLSYMSEDGVLFDKEKTKLICCPAGKTTESYSIPNSVTNIGDDAFSGCVSLISIKIPNSVASIGDWAFYACINLNSITLPSSVTNIGDYAFFYCTGLLSITNLNPIPINIYNYVFEYVDHNSCILKVPTGSVDLYKNALVWQDFQQIVDFTSIETVIPSATNISVYPNPVSESFRIDGITENTVVKILKTNGEIVLQRTIAPNETISVADLSKGIYIVQAAGKTMKIIKR